ncbi:unnamed protein product [Adineta steineri]|uniref:Fringe-like glycosyltransferase domain-containing protein n=1 Tax=Adineta steineri TaxID=433720 RepID=A0A818SS76_9BILA|nr:unnamed protein product [Adineta steineri]
MHSQCIFLVISVLFIPNNAVKRSSEVPPRLLIISLDGFRHEYLNEHQLPTINQFRNQGVQATHGMRPTYTTMTFPNHISIATGMYQEDHGVVHNTFFDRLLNKSIGMGSRDDGQWSDPNVEPLWITATKQNVKSAVLFWPACHNEFHGKRPLIYSWSYTDSIPFREKIDNAIGYFRELPVQLVMLYHFEPDKQGHDYGPNSPEVKAALFRLDSDIEYLLKRVKEDLGDDLNIIIVSDHGMTNVTKVIRPIYEKLLNLSSIEANPLSGALLNVMPRTGQAEQVENNLKNIPNVTVYKLDEMPERFHYSKPKHRLGNLTAIPDEGVILSTATTNATYPNKGNHGWDNTLASMQAIFMARGPSFNDNLQIHSLNNVDIYHIACRILKLDPNPHANAGSLNRTDIFNLNTRILCWIPTTLKRLDRAIVVYETWAKRCDRSLFIIGGSPPSIPLNYSTQAFSIVYLNNEQVEKRDQLSQKVLLSLLYIYNHYRYDYDWFFKGDDDTFVIVENLRYFLRRRFSNLSICYGYMAKTTNRYYPSGGAGYVLSQEALLQFGKRILTKPEQLKLCKKDEAEDINIAHCLGRINVFIMNLRDSQQLETFHPMTFQEHFMGNFTKWIREHAQFEQKKGEACCSPLSISFHALSIDEMKMMHFLLYRIQVASV